MLRCQKSQARLNAKKDVYAVNFTLGVTNTTSFHMFATNRTEFCHYHPGTTITTVLWGKGRFYRTNLQPAEQPVGSVYFLPRHVPHAFGHVGDPAVVTVAWSPPFHPEYTIPTTGCVGLGPEQNGTGSEW